MTPQERAVIDAAMARFPLGMIAEEIAVPDLDLVAAVEALIAARAGEQKSHSATPEHGRQYPVCNPLGCIHDGPSCERCKDYGSEVERAHNGDFGVLPCTCPLGPEDAHLNDCPMYIKSAHSGDSGATQSEPDPEPAWVPTTMTNCLINDRIRLGTEEATVIRSNHGIWHSNGDKWQPARWDHIELRLELDALPGFNQYDPATPIEMLCTPERLAALRLQEAFSGTTRIS